MGFHNVIGIWDLKLLFIPGTISVLLQAGVCDLYPIVLPVEPETVKEI